MVSYGQLINEWRNTMNDGNPSYRLGQHLINRLIKDSSSEGMQALWNCVCPNKAEALFFELTSEYDWDLQDMPVLSINNK